MGQGGRCFVVRIPSTTGGELSEKLPAPSFSLGKTIE